MENRSCGPDLSSEASGGFPINAVAPPGHGASQGPKSGGESQRARLVVVERSGWPVRRERRGREEAAAAQGGDGGGTQE